MQFRYYNPRIGSFLGRDALAGALANPCSLNGYSYVEGNPINFSDPTGLERCTLDIHFNFGGFPAGVEKQVKDTFTDILAHAGVDVNFVSGVGDYNLALTPGTVALFGLGSFTAREPSLGGAGVADSNQIARPNGYAFTDHLIAAQVGLGGPQGFTNRVGVALGRIAAHEFGHWAVPANDKELPWSPGGLMYGRPSIDSLFSTSKAARQFFTFTDGEASLIQRRCKRLRSGNNFFRINVFGGTGILDGTGALLGEIVTSHINFNP